MALLDAFVFEPFSVNEPLIDSLLLEPDQFEFWIRSETGAGPGTGTIDDPYDGSSQTLLDYLLSTFPPNTTVHLGPGTFQTKGYASGASGGWKPKSGQRLVGAGIDETILKLVSASDTANLTSAIGAPASNFLNGFEVADLTVDCNLAGQSPTSVACAAISISGTHIYIHRIRIINFGTQSTAVKGAAILIGNVDPSTPQVFDCVVEDCTIDQPSANNVRETTCIGIGAKEDSNGVMAFHRACVIRNCFIDCAYVKSPLIVTGITFVGASATVTTQSQHNLSAGDWVVVTGALENGVLSTKFNGSFLINSPMSNTFKYDMTGTPTYQPTGDMYIGRVPSQRVAIKTLTFAGGVATFETFTPHDRVPGQKVVVSNVTGMTPSINGPATINDLGSPTSSPTILRFNYAGSGTPDYSNSYIGADFRAIEADGGIGTIIENNRIYNCTFGCYHDFFSTKDMMIRDNYFRGVNAAVYQKMGGISPNGGANPTRSGSTLTRNGALAVFTTAQPHGLAVGVVITVTGSNLSQYNGAFHVASVPTPTSFTYAMSSDPGANSGGSPACNGVLAAVSLVRSKTLATFTTSAAHGFSFGQAVAVAGATPSIYNGTFAVASVPTPTTFTYLLPSDPGSDATGSLVFGALWQVGRLIIENNVIELILNVIPSGWEAPVGINLYDGVGSHGSQYIFQQVIARGNIIRHVDNASDSSQKPLALCLDSCLNAIVEGNDINLDATVPVRNYTVMSVKYFNNQSPGGKLIQGASCTRSGSYSVPIYFADTLNRYLNELTTDADLSVILTT